LIHEKYYDLLQEHEALLSKPNRKVIKGGEVFERYENPVLTKDHIPLFWRFDLDAKSNPYFLERLGVNAVFNPGAIYLNNKFYLVARVEGVDRKSFFAIAESPTGIDNFQFWDYPVILPDTETDETNVYDMRLVQHEDGWIYGIFCSESKDKAAPLHDLSSAIAQAGLVRTRDLIHWERLPNIKTKSPQQRNVVLHPEYVDGQYAFYTRPQDGFIDTGSGSGICFGLCKDITNPIIEEEFLVNPRIYHTIMEVKNGLGPAPIKTEKGWLNLAHGVRNTAAGLRYVLYCFVTDLHDPKKVIAAPGGYVLAPEGIERVGDVSNVLFSNGWVVTEKGDVYLYYASSDTRCHVATSTIGKLLDYCFNTPSDPLRSADCVEQRKALIEKNIRLLKHHN